MIYLVAILVAAGAALIGWPLGLAMFIAVFELLRLVQLEAVLDSPTALTAFRAAHVAAAIAAGLWLLHHWRPGSDHPLAAWKVVVLATVAGLGSALLAVPLIIVVLNSAQSLTPILASLVAALIAGAMVAAIAYRHLASGVVTAIRGTLASIIAVAILWLGFVFDSETSGFPASLGRPQTVQMDIRVPYGATRWPEPASIRVAIRSQGHDLPGEAQYWLSDRDGGLLRAHVPLVAGTRDRTVVLAMPNEPERHVRIDLPANPRRMQAFGSWLRFEGAADPTYELRYIVR